MASNENRTIIYNFFKKMEPLFSLEDLDYFLEAIEPSINMLHLAKGELFCSSFDEPNHWGIVEKGLLKSYINGCQGQEYIRCFYTEGESIAKYSSIIKNISYGYEIKALEESSILVMDLKKTRSLMEYGSIWNFFGRVLAEKHFCALEEREIDHVTLNAKEKYLKFLKNQKEISTRVEQIEIARYLAISPETLSRIKKSMR